MATDDSDDEERRKGPILWHMFKFVSLPPVIQGDLSIEPELLAQLDSFLLLDNTIKQANPRTRLLKAFQLIELKRTTNTKLENNTGSLQTMYLFTYSFPDCSCLGMALEFS